MTKQRIYEPEASNAHVDSVVQESQQLGLHVLLALIQVVKAG